MQHGAERLPDFNGAGSQYPITPLAGGSQSRRGMLNLVEGEKVEILCVRAACC